MREFFGRLVFRYYAGLQVAAGVRDHRGYRLQLRPQTGADLESADRVAFQIDLGRRIRDHVARRGDDALLNLASAERAMITRDFGFTPLPASGA